MRKMRMTMLGVLFCTLPLAAADGPTGTTQVVSEIINRENSFVAALSGYTPLIEIYMQDLRAEGSELVPSRDRYILGRASLSGDPKILPFRDGKGRNHRFSKGLDGLFSMQFVPSGFLWMIYVDRNNFDRDHYQFEYVGREFLGDVRCLAFDVRPRTKSEKGRFQGRIWVEDHAYNIVRFNGIYTGSAAPDYYFHFDSWRVNVAPGFWLPAVIYSAESDLKCCGFLFFQKHVRFKAQVRLWGYKMAYAYQESELGRVLVEAPAAVRDMADAGNDFSPIQQQRAWEHQAANNLIERLERFGLLAPRGDVDKVLETVVNNLEVTNDLAVEPEVRCRILLTSTLESFTVGHTIVLSRGLIDVLPDEASLATMLAHELAHIVLDHHVDSKYGFVDRVLIEQTDTFRHFFLARPDAEESAAAQRADELLRNSPYRDALGGASRFSQVLRILASRIPNLVSPHLGNRVPLQVAMQTDSLPSPDQNNAGAIGALPLGGRLRLDPWTNSVEMLKSKSSGVMSEREKMPLEVTPFFLYLRRQSTPSAQKPSAIADESAVRQQPK